jgi:glycosyltransferase involved in cell wall biosynthesis
VKHGVTGLVEPRPRDVRAVARALATLANDPETRQRMGRAARERVRADLDYDHLAQRLHQAIVRAEPIEGVTLPLVGRTGGSGPRR